LAFLFSQHNQKTWIRYETAGLSFSLACTPEFPGKVLLFPFLHLVTFHKLDSSCLTTHNTSRISITKVTSQGLLFIDVKANSSQGANGNARPARNTRFLIRLHPAGHFISFDGDNWTDRLTDGLFTVLAYKGKIDTGCFPFNDPDP
jgi:hypothetical protein